MINFDASTHTYYEDGLTVPGVTKILSNAKMIDFSMVQPDILERALKFGTAVHKATELQDKENLDIENLDISLMPYLEAWCKFKKDTGLTILSIEERVFSPRFRYAGTLDRRILLKRRHTVLDLKAGVDFHPASAVQLEAYKEAWNEGKPVKEKIKDRIIVQLCPDGTYKFPNYEYYQKTDFAVFLAALTLHNWRRKHGK